MKATFSKKDLKIAISTIKKFSKPSSVFLDIKGNRLYLIVSTEIIFMKYVVPCYNCEDGTVSINFDILENFLKLRNEDVSITQNNNSLEIKSGSSLKVNCNNVEASQLKEPEIDKTKIVKIPSYVFKNLSSIKFKYIITEDDSVSPVLIDNNEGLSLKMADNIQALKCSLDYEIKKFKFSVTTNFNYLKNIISLTDKEFTLLVDDKSFGVVTEDFKIITPQLNSVSTIENSLEFYKSEYYTKEKIEFSSHDILEIISSIGIIGGSEDRVVVQVIKDKIKFSINSTSGSSEDIAKVKNTYKDKLKFGIPLNTFKSLLDSINSEKVIFRLSENKKMFLMEGPEIKCIGPIVTL